MCCPTLLPTTALPPARALGRVLHLPLAGCRLGGEARCRGPAARCHTHLHQQHGHLSWSSVLTATGGTPQLVGSIPAPAYAALGTTAHVARALATHCPVRWRCGLAPSGQPTPHIGTGRIQPRAPIPTGQRAALAWPAPRGRAAHCVWWAATAAAPGMTRPVRASTLDLSAASGRSVSLARAGSAGSTIGRRRS